MSTKTKKRHARSSSPRGTRVSGLKQTTQKDYSIGMKFCQQKKWERLNCVL